MTINSTQDYQRADEIARILKPIETGAELQNISDVGDLLLRVEVLQLTREMLEEKYRSDEPNLWRTYAAHFYAFELEYMRKQRRVANRFRARMKAKGMAAEKVEEKVFLLSPGLKARLKDLQALKRFNLPMPWES